MAEVKSHLEGFDLREALSKNPITWTELIDSEPDDEIPHHDDDEEEIIMEPWMASIYARLLKEKARENASKDCKNSF